MATNIYAKLRAGVVTSSAAETQTLAAEFARQGRDWEQELRQRAKELVLMDELGLTPAPTPPTAPAGSAPAPKEDDTDGNEDPDRSEDPTRAEASVA